MKITGTWRDAGIGLQAAAGVETVHARHDRIHQDDIRRDAVDDVERGLAGGGDQYREAGLLERIGEEAQRFRGIIHDQHDITWMRLLHSPAALPCLFMLWRKAGIAGKVESLNVGLDSFGKGLIFLEAREIGELGLDAADIADFAQPDQFLDMGNTGRPDLGLDVWLRRRCSGIAV